jgi:hypothetical protein
MPVTHDDSAAFAARFSTLEALVLATVEACLPVCFPNPEDLAEAVRKIQVALLQEADRMTAEARRVDPGGEGIYSVAADRAQHFAIYFADALDVKLKPQEKVAMARATENAEKLRTLPAKVMN